MLQGTVSKRSRPVAIWLLVGVFMIIVQIILGGITRLTDSGLSITEWQPLLGAVPPQSEAEWNQAFEKYKQIAQYKHLHNYFSLDDFKAIFFWEWLHRVWGRLIGVAFAIPFVVFLLQRRFTRNMVGPLLVLFVLGGLQGAIGWIMVKSGLNNENLYVSHIRLAIHFLTALGLLAYTFWFALKLLVRPGQTVQLPASRALLGWIIGLLVIQLAYGAFMAGLKAALAAPTWPSINGSYLPAGIGSYQGKEGSFFSALVNNPITIHFIHRNLAYVLTVLVLLWTWTAVRTNGGALFNRLKLLPVGLVLLQVALGVVAVLVSLKKLPQRWGLFEWSALLHQTVAMLLLLSLVAVFFLHRRRGAAV